MADAPPSAAAARHPPPAGPSLAPDYQPSPSSQRPQAGSMSTARSSALSPTSGGGGSSNQTRAQPRHKVVFDLHLQHLALYDQPDGPRPLQPPLLWQASDARGSLKFRLRTRSPPSVCLLMDDSSHEMLIPLSFVTSLRILPPPASDIFERETPATGCATDAAPEGESEAEMEKRLRTGGLVLELGVMRGCKKDFRLRQPNSYVRLAAEGPPGIPERAGESEAIDFTGGAARLTNLIRLTIHATVTAELSHSMTSIVIRALRVRDGQLPQSSSTEYSPAAARALKAQEGNLSAEGYLKHGWRWPEHVLSPEDDKDLAKQRGDARSFHSQAATASTFSADTVRHQRPRSPPLLTTESHLELISSSSSSFASEGPTLLPPQAPPTPMPAGLLPAGLLPSNLLVDESSPEFSSAPDRLPHLLDPYSLATNGRDDPERTPVNRRFDAAEQLNLAYQFRHPSAYPPLDPPTPLQTFPANGPPQPPLPSHGRSLSLGLNMASPPPLLGPSSAFSHHRSISADSAPAIVPDSYWEPRTRRSSVVSNAWSDGSSAGASDASLSSADLAYLLDLAASSPAHEYWAPIYDKTVGAGADRFATAEVGSSGFYDGAGSTGLRNANAGESRPSSGTWSLGLADSLHGLSLGPPAAQLASHHQSRFTPLDTSVVDPAGSSRPVSMAQTDYRTPTESNLPDDPSWRPRQKSVPLPPPPSALLRAPSSDGQEGGAPPATLPFYPVLSSSHRW